MQPFYIPNYGFVWLYFLRMHDRPKDSGNLSWWARWSPNGTAIAINDTFAGICRCVNAGMRNRSGTYIESGGPREGGLPIRFFYSLH